MVMCIMAFPTDDRSKEFQIHDSASQQARDESVLFPDRKSNVVHASCCSTVSIMDYKGVVQLLALLPVKRTFFVLVISLEIEVKVQWFFATHQRQQQRRRRSDVSLITLTIQNAQRLG